MLFIFHMYTQTYIYYFVMAIITMDKIRSFKHWYTMNENDNVCSSTAALHTPNGSLVHDSHVNEELIGTRQPTKFSN